MRKSGLDDPEHPSISEAELKENQKESENTDKNEKDDEEPDVSEAM